jgi:hypothetical protein
MPRAKQSIAISLTSLDAERGGGWDTYQIIHPRPEKGLHRCSKIKGYGLRGECASTGRRGTCRSIAGSVFVDGRRVGGNYGQDTVEVGRIVIGGHSLRVISIVSIPSTSGLQEPFKEGRGRLVRSLEERCRPSSRKKLQATASCSLVSAFPARLCTGVVRRTTTSSFLPTSYDIFQGRPNWTKVCDIPPAPSLDWHQQGAKRNSGTFAARSEQHKQT